MTGFIGAEFLFEWLFKNGYSEKFVWKNLNRKTSKYTAAFFCKNCRLTNLHIFEITVHDNIHYVSKLSLNIFCKIHGIGYESALREIGAEQRPQ